VVFSVGKAADTIGTCGEYIPEDSRSCRGQLVRDYHADFSSQSLPTVDPYRAHYLGTKRTIEEQRQNRACDAPQDDFDRRRLERDLGRVYVNDDVSGMTKAARRGIESTKDVRPKKQKLVSA
jgi:hypothetical protein